MTRNHVVRGVISGTWPDVQAWCRLAPGRFIAGPLLFYPPSIARSPDPDTATLHRAYQAGCLGVIGEIASQYAGIAPNDSVLEPYWALAEQLDLPVAIHTGSSFPGVVYACCPNFRLRFGNPLLLDDVLARHPKLRLYLMHAGAPWLEETAALLDMYPRVYVDVAMINWIDGPAGKAEFHRFLKWLIDRGYEKRIMFGSDVAEWPDAIGLALDGVTEAPFLTKRQKRDILYENAARFFRIGSAR